MILKLNRNHIFNVFKLKKKKKKISRKNNSRRKTEKKIVENSELGISNEKISFLEKYKLGPAT